MVKIFLAISDSIISKAKIAELEEEYFCSMAVILPFPHPASKILSLSDKKILNLLL